MYSCALGESGKAGNVVGIEAPFCVSNSAIGKAAIFGAARGDEEIGKALLVVEAGEAGSAAARARKTVWVFRDRSVALGLARRARAYSTPWMSFFLIEARRVSSGVEKWEKVVEMDSTYARSTYLALMNFNR